jgi:hypothetical protein
LSFQHSQKLKVYYWNLSLETLKTPAPFKGGTIFEFGLGIFERERERERERAQGSTQTGSIVFWVGLLGLNSEHLRANCIPQISGLQLNFKVHCLQSFVSRCKCV